MISICAMEITLGQVMMWVLIIALIGVVFHGLHGKRQNMQPSFTRGQLPLTVLHHL
jgi:FtsZ-interacting cell division protein ZipA